MDRTSEQFDKVFLENAQRYVEMKEYEMSLNTYVENNEINMDISQEEITTVIRKLKNNKSCGIDGVPNEVLKHEGIFSLLVSFINICFKYSLMPTVWTLSIIKPISKSSTRDPHVPLNYRGISLLSCISNILSGILNNRLCEYYNTHNIIVDEQNGFRKGRSCEEHVFTLTNIIKNRLSNGRSTFIAFVDLEKAFDWVDRTLLFYKLLMENIDGKTYKIIRKIYENTQSCLQLNNLITDWFAVNSGVRQGDNLSPTLFSFLINSLAKVINDLGKGICVGNDKVNIFFFFFFFLFSSNETVHTTSTHNIHTYKHSITYALHNEYIKLARLYLHVKWYVSNYIKSPHLPRYISI